MIRSDSTSKSWRRNKNETSLTFQRHEIVRVNIMAAQTISQLPQQAISRTKCLTRRIMVWEDLLSSFKTVQFSWRNWAPTARAACRVIICISGQEAGISVFRTTETPLRINFKPCKKPTSLNLWQCQVVILNRRKAAISATSLKLRTWTDQL